MEPESDRKGGQRRGKMLAQEMEDGGDNTLMEKVINGCVKAGITEGLTPMKTELQKLRQRPGGGKVNPPSSDSMVKNKTYASPTHQRKKENSHPMTNGPQTKTQKKKKKGIPETEILPHHKIADTSPALQGAK